MLDNDDETPETTFLENGMDLLREKPFKINLNELVLWKLDLIKQVIIEIFLFFVLIENIKNNQLNYIVFLYSSNNKLRNYNVWKMWFLNLLLSVKKL